MIEIFIPLSVCIAYSFSLFHSIIHSHLFNSNWQLIPNFAPWSEVPRSIIGLYVIVICGSSCFCQCTQTQPGEISRGKRRCSSSVYIPSLGSSADYPSIRSCLLISNQFLYFESIPWFQIYFSIKGIYSSISNFFLDFESISLFRIYSLISNLFLDFESTPQFRIYVSILNIILNNNSNNITTSIAP